MMKTSIPSRLLFSKYKSWNLILLRISSPRSSSNRHLSTKRPKEKFPPISDLGENVRSTAPKSFLNYNPDITQLNPHYTLNDQRVIPPLDAEADPSGISRANAADIIDLSSMYDPAIHLPDIPDFNDPKEGFEVATPLGNELMKYIAVLGRPITVSDFMHRCLRDENLGYYTNPPLKKKSDDSVTDLSDWDNDLDTLSNEPINKGKGNRLIGKKGDFTTAPEISQIFGECIAIWLLTQYEMLNKPSRIQLIEIGPGRGTLMCDILRSAIGIKGVGQDFLNALNSRKIGAQGVHLVEVSESLRLHQQESLSNLMKSISDVAAPFNFVKWKPKAQRQREIVEIMKPKLIGKREGDFVEPVDPSLLSDSKESTFYESQRITVQWHDNISSVPTHSDDEPVPTFIICQELMDALPIHAFQKTDKGWRERLVDLAVNESKSDISLAHLETNDRQASRSLSQYSTVEDVNDLKLHTNGKRPRFRFVLAPDRTPALTSLLNVNPEGRVEGMGSVKLDSAPEGSIIEVCPEAMILAQDIALRIDSCTGAALIIDYGDEGSSDSLRAFNMHKQVSVLSSPGMVDVTADVDFRALREAINIGLESIWNNNTRNRKLGKPIAFGPITQAKFLASMGAMERSIMLIEDEKTSDEQAEELYNALERLVSPEQMGERYKVLAIAYKKDGIFPPPGF